MKLLAAGLRDSQISRRTGMPRSTISAWRHGRGVTYHRRLSPAPAWRPRRPDSYCYLLGLYLGDGCLYVSPTGFATIVITLDVAYPGIVEQAIHASRRCFPDTPVHRVFQSQGSVAAVKMNHPARPDPFGRLPHDQPLQDEASQRPRRFVRVSPLLLLEPLRRHPAHLLRAAASCSAFGGLSRTLATSRSRIGVRSR